MRKIKILQFCFGLAIALLICIFPLNQFQTSSIQTIAVQLDGRKKPLDTVARETITQIHGSQHYQTLDGQKLGNLALFQSLWFNNRDWNQEPFILFNYRPLKQRLGFDSEKKYFTFAELAQSKLGNVILAASEKQAQDQTLNREEQEALALEERLGLMIERVGRNNLALVPHPSNSKERWITIAETPRYYDSSASASLEKAYQQFEQTASGLAQPSQSTVTDSTEQLKAQLRALSPTVYPSQQALSQEVRFSQLHPFAKAWVLFALAWVLVVINLLLPRLNTYTTAMGIFSGGLLIQMYGFLQRMQIADRPPVTNMYESIIWVAFGISAIAFLFEVIHRARFYLLAAAPLSIICLLLADRLPAVLDASIQPLVPVLRDNFWLSIHVPTITLGYASFALALGLGHILLLYYYFSPDAKERIRQLSRWNYGVLQVGVLLLTTGIILGGIWAHFSWGRFWGWDPKETWAFIALMCYVIPLHGKLVGWLGDYGLAVTSVVSFNAVLMAWYGVNFVLGTGLHSYGFSHGGSTIFIVAFVILDLLFVIGSSFQHRRFESVQ